MNPARLASRLKAMSRKEFAFRVRVAARTEAGRVAAAWREPRWRTEDLASLLDPARPLPARAASCLAAGDRHGAHALLREHFLGRDNLFPVSRAALEAVSDDVLARDATAVVSARAEAARLEKGRFDLLGYRDLDVSIGVSTGPAAIDWHRDPVHDRRAPRTWWSRVRFLDPSVGDHKIIWELNRHQHFLRLARAAWLIGDRSPSATFESHLRGWLEQNPPGIGVNWASMLELGLRSISWLWALHLFVCLPDDTRHDSTAPLDEEPWIPDLLAGLHAQLQQVRSNLSRYFSPNTHLTGEALALYLCGLALPELRASRAWADTGREVLLEQIAVQVTPDGGHCERSTHYLRYTLDFYLMALAFARAAGDRPAVPALEDACSRLACATRALCDAHGRLPALGDDDGGRLWPMRHREPCDARDSLAIAAVLLDRPDLSSGSPPEEALWLLGPIAPRPPAVSRGAAAPSDGQCLAAGERMGYVVARPGASTHLVIDGGPHGFLNGGHAHADALSLVYTLGGCPLAIDPGTYTYTMSPEWRDRLRSSPWHNTLTLDGRSQSVPRGPFHWEHTADARVQASVSNGEWHFFEGVHDGYLPAVHRRRVAALPEGVLVVVDSVLGAGRHRADVHWHLHPAWRATAGPDRGIAARHEQAGEVDLVFHGAAATLFRGDETTGLGWHSPVFGQLLPCTTVRLTAEGELPLVVVSVFAPRGRVPVRVEPGWPTAGGSGTSAVQRDDAVAVRLHFERHTETLLFTARPVQLPGDEQGLPAPPAAPAPGREFCVGTETFYADARFAWLSSGPGRHAWLRAAVDGTARARELEDSHVRHRRVRRG